MGSFFDLLYPLVIVLSGFGYIPQIRKLMKPLSDASGFSLRSWFVWLLSSLITLGYAAFSLADLAFSLTALFSVTMNITVIALVLRIRFIRSGQAHSLCAALYLWVRQELSGLHGDV